MCSFWTYNFLKQNYVQQIIIWTRRRRENRDATLYSWKVDRHSRLQLFDQHARFQASACALSLTGLFAVAAAAHARATADWIWFCFLRHFLFFFTYVSCFGGKFHGHKFSFCFRSSSFDMKYKSSVARSVFLFSAFFNLLSVRQK